MSELWERLEREILPLVVRPSRYIGEERNARVKHPESVALSFLLAFPDVYEIGMPHAGLRILYDILNRRPDLAAERCFAPWLDMRAIMKEKGIPLFSHESKRPARDFDVVGFTLQYELHYTGVVAMLDLAGIPLRSEKRSESDPLVVAGGPCVFNPEPAADFFDLMVLGDGETAVLELADLLIEGKRQRAGRRDLLVRAASIPGVYVPSLYRPSYEDGRYAGTFPVAGEAPVTVARRAEPVLDYANHPSLPLVPLTEVAHDRIGVEMMRGCTRGCRFCSAGMVTRPVRERPAGDIVNLVEEGIATSGYDEVSLGSLSASDYSDLTTLVSSLSRRMFDHRVSVALPSLRIDRFGLDLAKEIGRVRKPGLTFAPEAGTQRLRDVINKKESEEDLLTTVGNAFASGWNRVKLYFMIGLPTESAEDVEAIADLVKRVRSVAREYRAGARVSVSVSPFVPKAHTPFQWERQDSIEEMEEKEGLLKQLLRIRGVKLALRDPEVSFLECVMARGDRKLSRAIERAWRLGASLDSWTEAFDFGVWRRAFEETGIEPGAYTGELDASGPLFWDHISGGPSKDFLLGEREKALRGELTPDCREVGCLGCGACREVSSVAGPAEGARGREAPREREAPGSGERAERFGAALGTPARDLGRRSGYGRRVRVARPGSNTFSSRWRIQYSKGESVRFLSHLDVARNFARALRISGLPVSYSQGFNPHPRISFGPPLPVGVAGVAELLDIEFSRRVVREEVEKKLGASLPAGIDLVSARPVPSGPSIVQAAEAAEYVIRDIPGLVGMDTGEIESRMAELTRVERLEVVRRGVAKEILPASQILELELVGAERRVVRAVLRLGRKGSVRPADIALLLGDPKCGDPRLARAHRTALLKAGGRLSG